MAIGTRRREEEGYMYVVHRYACISDDLFFNIDINIYIYIYVCVFRHIYVYLYMCIYVY